MKKELGLGRCGLACCLCSGNEHCGGCDTGDCPFSEKCENRACSLKKGLEGCWECEEDCRRGLLQKIKPYGFRLYARRYGKQALLDRLELNERAGVCYHRVDFEGDYDDFADVEALIAFIRTGKRADS